MNFLYFRPFFKAKEDFFSLHNTNLTTFALQNVPNLSKNRLIEWINSSKNVSAHVSRTNLAKWIDSRFLRVRIVSALVAQMLTIVMIACMSVTVIQSFCKASSLNEWQKKDAIIVLLPFAFWIRFNQAQWLQALKEKGFHIPKIFLPSWVPRLLLIP